MTNITTASGTTSQAELELTGNPLIDFMKKRMLGMSVDEALQTPGIIHCGSVTEQPATKSKRTKSKRGDGTKKVQAQKPIDTAQTQSAANSMSDLPADERIKLLREACAAILEVASGASRMAMESQKQVAELRSELHALRSEMANLFGAAAQTIR